MDFPAWRLIARRYYNEQTFMTDLLELHKTFLSRHLREGAVAADCTMGNGHDTLWLSRSVGATGRVIAFDIQEKAVENTSALLASENAPQNYRLLLDSHANLQLRLAEWLGEDARLDACVFNLGWLPGSGDRSVTTLRESTLAAAEAALELLAPDGCLLVAVYPGHPEGAAEGEMLTARFAGLDRREYSAICVRLVNSPASPFFFVVERSDRGAGAGK